MREGDDTWRTRDMKGSEEGQVGENVRTGTGGGGGGVRPSVRWQKKNS